MAQEHNEHIQVVQGRDFERQQRVVEASPTSRSVFVSRFTQFMWLVTALVSVLLSLRFVFSVIQANPATPFVDLIYRVTNGLVAPFAGIVNLPGLDIAALIAILVYVLASWLVITLFRLLFADTNRVRKVTTVDYER